MTRLLPFWALILFLGSVLPCLAAPSLVDNYRQALAADPQNQTLRYHLGVALLNQGENRQALKAFRVAYSSRLDDPEMNFNLALVYSRLGDPDSALIYLEQSLASGAASQPDIYPVHNIFFNLALLYKQQGRLDEAIHLLLRLQKENPSDLEYLRLLGSYQIQLGDIDEGVKNLSRYLQKVPEDNEARAYAFATLYNRGLTAYGKKDQSIAHREFSRSLAFIPDSPQALYYLALLDYQQAKYLLVAKRLPQIYANLNEELKTSARSILYNTALSLKFQGKLKEAQRVLGPICLVASPRAKDLSLLASIQLKQEEYPEARQNYLRALQDNPGYAPAVEGLQVADRGTFDALLTAAGAAFSADDMSQVHKILDQAAEIFPQDNRLRIDQLRLKRVAKEHWAVLQHQAESHEKQHQYVEALALLRQGLLLAPEEPQLQRHEKRLIALLKKQINALYRQGQQSYNQGDLISARTRFEQLVELSPTHQGGNDYLQRINGRLQKKAQRLIAAGNAALGRTDLSGAQRDFQHALVAWPSAAEARDGLQKTDQMRRSQVSKILVKARRARTAGRLLEAQKILNVGLKKWPAILLKNELSQVKKELSLRQKSLMNLAREALQQREFNRGTQLLIRARQLGPGSIELAKIEAAFVVARKREVAHQLTLAQQKATAGHAATVLKIYRRVLDLDPGNTDALTGLKRGRSQLSTTISRLLSEGVRAHQSGRRDLAMRLYRKVLNLDSQQTEALKALRQLDRERATSLSSADSRRIYLQGIELYTEGDYNQAIAAWRQVLDLDPANEKAKMNIDKAKRKLRQILERQRG